MIAIKNTVLHCSIASWFFYYLTSGKISFLYLNMALAAFLVLLGCGSVGRLGKGARTRFLSLVLLVAAVCFIGAVKSTMLGTIDLGVVTISLNLLCGVLVAKRLLPAPSFYLPALAVGTPVAVCLITGSTLNELLPHSVNHVSIYYLAAISLLFIEGEANSFRKIILVLGVGLLLFFQDGRSNTLIGALLISLALLQLWITLRIGSKLFSRPKLVLFLAAGVAGSVGPELIGFLAESEARFNKDIFQGPRIQILRGYTESMAPSDIIFGRSAEWSSDAMGLSMHNSYLTIHQSTGLLLFFLVVFFTKQMLMIFDSNTFLKGAVICVILLRAGTDSFLLDWGVVFGYLIFSSPISRKVGTKTPIASKEALGV